MATSIFREILDRENNLCLGCTEPVMYAVGGAFARKYATGNLKRVTMVGNGLMVAGVQAVGIPNTGGKTGAFLATAVGFVNGDPEARKEVLHNVKPNDVAVAEELVKNCEFDIDIDNSTGRQVYLKMVVETDEQVATIIFEDEHTDPVYVDVDGKVIRDERKPLEKLPIPFDSVDWDVFTLEGIYEWCKTCDINELERAKEGIAVNRRLAQDGIDNPRGIQTARVLLDNVNSGFVAGDEITHILVWATAGADARMGGSDFPAMVSTGSGNQGAMVIMGPAASAEYRGDSEEDAIRAVAFALLVNSYLKYHAREFWLMPPTCACAGTSAQASAAGVAFLHGLNPKQINDMLCTCLTHMAGVVCDGAKPSCAFRMFVSLFGCLQAMMMAEKGIRAGAEEGFVHERADVTCDNIYRLQRDVLYNKVDPVVWSIFKDQKNIH